MGILREFKLNKLALSPMGGMPASGNTASPPPASSSNRQPVKPNVISEPALPKPGPVAATQNARVLNPGELKNPNLATGLAGTARGLTSVYRDLTSHDAQGESSPQYLRAGFDAAQGIYDASSAISGASNKLPAVPSAPIKTIAPSIARAAGKHGLIAGGLGSARALLSSDTEGNRTPNYGEAAAYAGGGAGLYGLSRFAGKNPIVAKGISKILPGAGSAVSAYSAKNRFDRGDYVGAGIDSLSGVAGLAGPGGAVPSILLDTANAGRDIYKDVTDTNSIERLKRDAANAELDKRRNLRMRLEAEGYVFDKNGNPMFKADARGNRIKEGTMKTSASRFEQDIADSAAGRNSDLYKAISPMISSESDSNLGKPDRERVDSLKEDIRKGLVGLEYMTGLKKNTGETFYDEHPAQAVATDILGNYGKIGLGVGGGGLLANALRQHSNMKMTEPARMARSGNKEVDATHPRNLLQPEKGRVRGDIARLFGDLHTNPERRLGLLDEFVKQRGGTSSLLEEFGKAVDPEERKKILQRAALSEGHSGLEKYVDLHESLQRAKQQGGFKKYVGEKLHNLSDGPVNNLLKKLAPDSHQAVADLLEKYNITGAHTNFDEPLIRDIVKEYRGGKSLHSDPQGQAFIDKTLQHIKDPKYQASGIKKFLGRNKLPIAGGAAAALGSAGLYGLIKAIQNQAYSKDKTNDWKKTLLQSRGDFDAANQIK